jgi:hypothetical protein
MIESEIVAAGSVNGVLSGKHYNRCMRAHKLIFEAMHRMRFEAFCKSLPEAKADELKAFGAALLLQCPDSKAFTDTCNGNAFDAWRVVYDSFVEKRSEENPTFAFFFFIFFIFFYFIILIKYVLQFLSLFSYLQFRSDTI